MYTVSKSLVWQHVEYAQVLLSFRFAPKCDLSLFDYALGNLRYAVAQPQRFLESGGQARLTPLPFGTVSLVWELVRLGPKPSVMDPVYVPARHWEAIPPDQ